jgi:hypothetical protein
MLRYDEISNSYLQQEMLTFEERVWCGNQLQQSGSGLELDPQLNQEIGPVANTSQQIALYPPPASGSVYTLTPCNGPEIFPTCMPIAEARASITNQMRTEATN